MTPRPTWALLAVAGLVLGGCGEPGRDAGTGAGQDVASTTPLTLVAPPVDTLAPDVQPVESPAPFTVVDGSLDLAGVVRSVDPLVIDTFGVTPPGAAAVATNGRGGTTLAAGDTVELSYQLYSWQTGEFYDGTPAGELRQVVVGANDLPGALDRALRWAAAGERLLVVIPARAPDLPAHLPDDSAYYAVVDVFGTFASEG